MTLLVSYSCRWLVSFLCLTVCHCCLPLLFALCSTLYGLPWCGDQLREPVPSSLPHPLSLVSLCFPTGVKFLGCHGNPKTLSKGELYTFFKPRVYRRLISIEQLMPKKTGLSGFLNFLLYQRVTLNHGQTGQPRHAIHQEYTYYVRYLSPHSASCLTPILSSAHEVYLYHSLHPSPKNQATGGCS